MRYLVVLIFAVVVVALAFRQAPDLPGTNFDESFLPKASSVKYVAAGNDASVAGLFWIKGLTELGESYLTGKEYAYLNHVGNLCTELDSLFYTPYYFISGVTSVDSQDTTDFIVLRRALRNYPDQWRLAVALALRLSKGPYVDKAGAADIMRPYFDSPDTTIPAHIRTMYRSFELDQEQTETALEMVLNDLMQPKFQKFKGSFYNKTYRILGYRGLADPADSVVFERVKETVDFYVDGKIPPLQAYHSLLSLKKVEEPVVDTTAVADTTAAAAVTDTTATVQ